MWANIDFIWLVDHGQQYISNYHVSFLCYKNVIACIIVFHEFDQVCRYVHACAYTYGG